jgi:hypothetical protein
MGWTIRPVGDSARQRQVVDAALRLLETNRGAPTIELWEHRAVVNLDRRGWFRSLSVVSPGAAVGQP